MKKILSMDEILKQETIVAILMVIAVVITTLCMSNIIRRIDFTPATQTEWNYLYKQVATFEEKGIEPFCTTEDIEITFEGKYVKIETKQCGVIFETDNEHNFKEIERFDKAYLNSDAVVVIIALIFADAIVSMLFFFIEVVVLVLYLKWVQLWCDFAKKTHNK